MELMKSMRCSATLRRFQAVWMKPRVANMGTSNVRQLLLLLSWTVFVCCVVYLSRLGTIPGTPDDSPAILHASRSKRFSALSETVEDHCTNTVPLRDITKLLEDTAYEKGRVPEAPFVHCSVLGKCSEGDDNDTVNCHSTMCSQFKLHFKNPDRVYSWLTGEELSGLVKSHLAGKTLTNPESIGNDTEIHCQHPHSQKLQLAADILPSVQQCSQKLDPQLTGSEKETQTLKSIHILYFRFLSHWELSVLFPGLTAFMEDSSQRKGLRLMKFPNHQATLWDDDEVLFMLLHGRSGRLNTTASLLDTVQESGRCFRLVDLSCGSSSQMQRLVSNVTGRLDVACADRPLPNRQASMEILCRGENATDSNTRRALTSLLLHLHGGDTMKADDRPRLTVSLLHAKDFPNPSILDASLKNLLVSLLSDPSNVVLIMSGVGSPEFLTFDEDVRLHIQASNPALLLATSGTLSKECYSLAEHLNQSLFSMTHVHKFVQTLLGKQRQAEASTVHGNKSQPVGSRDRLMNEESCRSLNVSPPFSCLCEEQFVDYENDTLMIGFAEFAVNVINSQLSKRQPTSFIAASSSFCSRWSGLLFSKVRVGRHARRKRILMDLLLENELSRETVLRRVTLDLWDLDKVPRAEVHFYEEGKAPWNSGERLWKTICVTGDNMDGAATKGALLLKRWSEERHFGHKARATQVHDACLHLLLRDLGDSLSVEAANVCVDRRYHVTLHLSLLNMISLNALPLSVNVGPVARQTMAAIVKVSYTVPTFAYKLYPDFEVSYEV